MKVEIWSDVICPFCYIGKRLFEKALNEFDFKENVEVTWRSFELSPDLKTDPTKNTYQYLAEKKGWTVEQSKQIHAQLIERAKEVGLHYNFDSAIPANSFDAHRLSHLAKEKGFQNEMEERLFQAHFSEGLNIDDTKTVISLGAEVGLDEDEVQKVLESDLYSEAVEADKYAARQIGVQGVPFFVFDNKYAISGAQPLDVFKRAIQKTWEESDEKASL